VRCELLLEIYSHHAALVRLMREFGSRPEAKRKSQAAAADRQMSLLDL